ncbi:hypothetical protein ABIC83_002388 [Roseateles asaccharophilus]|uniref:hypothetical protein n=1 Tax=Roseateles asaccharophilus TaxID=582607 RepID=UPI0038337E91
MGFVTRQDEYFAGWVREPGGDKEVVVVERGTRAAAINLTVAEANKRNWDWFIDLRQDLKDEDNSVATLAHWSSVAGELPPASRSQVPGLP